MTLPMHELLTKQNIDFLLLAITSIFTMVNPFGVMPLFIGITDSRSVKESHQIATKATLTAFFVMVLFAVSGQFIFKFFSISIDSLKVVGGVLFFLMGFDMLQARAPRTKSTQAGEELDDDVAITPLGVPMICGPGTITVVILLNQQATTVVAKISFFTAMVVVAVLTYLFLMGAKPVLKALGRSGNSVMTRIMGLILMMIAVEYFFAGMKQLIFNLK